MTSLNYLTEERQKVIKNIEAAVKMKNSFAKTELYDPKPSDDDIRRIILPFDNERRAPIAKIKAFTARKIAESMTSRLNENTSVVGLENALNINSGAIITSNHYNPTDSTPIRILATLMGKRKSLHISVQESNIFMRGIFRFLMRNCNTHPFSKCREYMVKNLRPSIEKILNGGGLFLIYPEQEMWFNYKKPRALRDGAYHYAALFGVPIIPTFTEMQTLNGERDGNGFLPIKHTLHVLPPIYPDPKLTVRENRVYMQETDYNYKKATYESVYNLPLTDDFISERDIAGLSCDFS